MEVIPNINPENDLPTFSRVNWRIYAHRLEWIRITRFLYANKKSPRGIRPRRCSPPPGGVKYVTVTQDKSPWLCSERHDEYFFGRTKTGGLGQVTTKKKNNTEKKGVLPDPSWRRDNEVHNILMTGLGTHERFTIEMRSCVQHTP